ncbi:type II toxin-antitoxin system HigB family toxin [Marinimicrobium sp. ABcell2]|uniref:type II toxin-antitoxin system HigB family toxin n=1 Tax=Marinimicrobium sp. ABcell2 TaxID=3069751 RepID=UPI0027B3E7E1|nr:type II toxin-antitoxin system HigB family toxin [Marinimicrobium sp. ABcell2]MDQ2076877.1 type II toxin-antitoxin system HigB family toxin [Marinimicrobium sp. ABcell2]
MRVLGRDKLDAFIRKHANSKSALGSWLAEAEEATWETPDQVRDRYPRASILPNNKVVFRLKGNDYRLVVTARYQRGILKVEWVGTHAEYDKQTF